MGHPGVERAQRQWKWLESQAADVIVLTETSQNAGCEYLQNAMHDAGYHVVVSLPEGREYGAIVASRCAATTTDFTEQLTYLPYRCVSAYLADDDIEIVGVYVPSRDGALAKSESREAAKIERKRQFLEQLLRCVARPLPSGRRILCGDFNVITRDDSQSESLFLDWEYAFLDALDELGYQDAHALCHPTIQEHSWFGVNGDRFRFDYCYVSDKLRREVADSWFAHDAREGRSDHSALLVTLASP